METKHTPGPWKINEGQTYRTTHGALNFTIQQDDGSGFSTVICETFSTNNSANAKLIAAAPEILAALNNILHVCGTVNFSSHNQMREAIETTVHLSEEAIKKATE